MASVAVRCEKILKSAKNLQFLITKDDQDDPHALTSSDRMLLSCDADSSESFEWQIFLHRHDNRFFNVYNAQNTHIQTAMWQFSAGNFRSVDTLHFCAECEHGLTELTVQLFALVHFKSHFNLHSHVFAPHVIHTITADSYVREQLVSRLCCVSQIIFDSIFVFFYFLLFLLLSIDWIKRI